MLTCPTCQGDLPEYLATCTKCGPDPLLREVIEAFSLFASTDDPMPHMDAAHALTDPPEEPVPLELESSLQESQEAYVKAMADAEVAELEAAILTTWEGESTLADSTPFGMDITAKANASADGKKAEKGTYEKESEPWMGGLSTSPAEQDAKGSDEVAADEGDWTGDPADAGDWAGDLTAGWDDEDTSASAEATAYDEEELPFTEGAADAGWDDGTEIEGEKE